MIVKSKLNTIMKKEIISSDEIKEEFKNLNEEEIVFLTTLLLLEIRDRYCISNNKLLKTFKKIIKKSTIYE